MLKGEPEEYTTWPEWLELSVAYLRGEIPFPVGRLPSAYFKVNLGGEWVNRSKHDCQPWEDKDRVMVSETRSIDFDAGFLIVETYPLVYENYLKHHDPRKGGPLSHPIYAVAWPGISAEEQPVRYRGLYRGPIGSKRSPADPGFDEHLNSFKEIFSVDVPAWMPHFEERLRHPLQAEVRLYELENAGKSDVDFIFDLADALDVYEKLLAEEPSGYEMIWTRIVYPYTSPPKGLRSHILDALSSSPRPPDGFRSAGFDPTYFYGDHFSASCDCMMFPMWHGTDEEGVLFRQYFEKLNPDGLFRTAADAREFLEYYLSFDWTEHAGDYFLAEVFLPS